MYVTGDLWIYLFMYNLRNTTACFFFWSPTSPCLLKRPYLCLGGGPAKAGEQWCRHSNKASESMGNNSMCWCLSVWWLSGVDSLQGVCSSSLGTEVNCKQLFQSPSQTTRCSDQHALTVTPLDTHTHTHTHTHARVRLLSTRAPVRHAQTVTHAQSAACCARQHTVETFMTPSDLVSVRVCRSGGGCRH